MTNQKPYILADMTWPEVKEALKEVKLAIVPSASTEQHGPGLTLSTDAAIAYNLCVKIAERMHPRTIVAPMIPFGISYHHLPFPGTLTLSHETFQTVISEIVQSLKHHGIDKFLLFTGHGGNDHAVKLVADKLRHTLGVKTAAMFYFGIIRDVMAQEAQSDHYGHACEIEGSLGMYLAPEILRADSLAKGEVKDLPFGGMMGIEVPHAFDEGTANGALGDVTKSSYDVGKKLADAVVERTAEFLDRFISQA